jgi:uncharacterized protein YlxW (UPF0749 family)
MEFLATQYVNRFTRLFDELKEAMERTHRNQRMLLEENAQLKEAVAKLRDEIRESTPRPRTLRLPRPVPGE